MTRTRMLMLSALALGLVVAVAGCFLKRDENRQRVVLKADWQVADDTVGWVAVANTAPKEVANAGLTYAVLSTHNVVPDKLNGWYAMNPALFEKTTGIKVAAQNTPPGEMWEMRPGRRVPKEKDGWIGLPVTYPQVQKEGDAALAILSADQLIPKEMDGWVALTKESVAKLASDKQKGLITEPETKPIPDAGALKGKEVKIEPKSK